MFDVTRKITYKNLPQWYKELREYRAEIPCLCTGNKIDGKLTQMVSVSKRGKRCGSTRMKHSARTLNLGGGGIGMK